MNENTKAGNITPQPATDAMVPQSYMLIRPRGEDGWCVMGPARDPATLQGLLCELEVCHEQDTVMEVQLQELHPMEVEAMHEFDGW